MDLTKVEALFNELFDFNNLVRNATKYIENILLESDTNFLSEEVTDEFCAFNKLRIEYNMTYLLINKLTSMPSFRLKFHLIESNAEILKYVYEIEYNCSGEFLDEYFLDY